MIMINILLLLYLLTFSKSIVFCANYSLDNEYLAHMKRVLSYNCRTPQPRTLPSIDLYTSILKKPLSTSEVN